MAEITAVPVWTKYNLTEEQYEDIVAPYKVLLAELLKNQPGKVLIDPEIHKMD